MPYIQDYLHVNLPAIPPYYFYILGLFMSLLFLYISRAYAIRLRAIGETYKDLVKMLNQEYQRKTISEISKLKIYEMKISNVVPFILFIAIFAIGVILLVSSIFPIQNVV